MIQLGTVGRSFNSAWRVSRIVALALLSWVGLTTAASAQGVGQLTLPTDTGIKGRLSLTVSGGLDLDVFGEVVTPGLSCSVEEDATPETACNQQLRIVQLTAPLHYPDVYVSTPFRVHAAAGFGIFRRDELIVQFSRSRSSAEPGIRVGRLLSAEGDRDLDGTFTAYDDMSIEGGWRHYFKATGKSKKYVNLLFGRRTVEAISADLAGAGADGDLGTVRFYDKATVPTGAVVFGITYEPFKHLGIFLEGGFRFTGKLTQQDADLDALSLGTINDSGKRIFMPANLGLVFRF